MANDKDDANEQVITLDLIAREPQYVDRLTPLQRTLLLRLLLRVNAAFGLHAKRDPVVAEEGIDESYLEPAEVARMLKKSIDWVNRHSHQCGGIKVGREWRFPRARVRAAIRKLG